MTDATLTVSLPQSVRRHIDERVAAGDYATADEYVRLLIEDAMQRRVEDELEARLLAGIDSGEGVVADWAAIRDAAYRLAAAGKPARG